MKLLPYTDSDICTVVPETTHTIPKRIFTIWHTLDLPPMMTIMVDHMKRIHSDFEYTVYDVSMCETFLRAHFTNEVVQASRRLIPMSYKSDLWRFCLMYIYGGIYYDVKFHTVGGFTFHQLLDREYVCNDTFERNQGFNVLTGLLVCKPRNPYMLVAIKRICSNIRTQYYGEHSLMPTGPGLLGVVFPQRVYDMRLGAGEADHTNSIIMNGVAILKGYPQYRKEQTMTHYSELWKARKIYG